MDVSFESGKFGIRAVVRSVWTSALHKQIAEAGCAEIELNRAKGWHGRDVSFLDAFPHLKACAIIDRDIESVEPVHTLHALESLQVSTHCGTPLRFDQFPLLRECGFEWRPGSGSVFSCKSLRSLSVNGLKSVTNLEVLSGLPNLETLTLLSPSIESLDGLAATGVQALRVALARRLTSLEGLATSVAARKLWLQSCTKLGTIDAVGRHGALTYLNLDRCGSIASLQPLESCVNLDVLFFWGTQIADGTLEPIRRLPKLQYLGFDDRRRYSHRSSDFQQTAARPAGALFP